MPKQFFNVQGMHCASCALVIGKKLQKLAGVTKAEVNYATEKAQIDFEPEKVTIDAMNNEISSLGYKLSTMVGAATADHSQYLDAKEGELEELRQKTHFVVPLTFLVFSMMMWEIATRTFAIVPNLPLPMGLYNVVLLILATAVMFWVGKPFTLGVARFIRYRVANMDTLVGIGTLAAYLYSATVVLLPQVKELFRLPEFTYFDVVIVVIGFVTLGKYLEARSKKQTGQAIEKLLNLQAKTAVVIREGKEMEIPVTEVVVGDYVVVKPGAKIPVDGSIVEGTTSIDESMVTGESIPVDKKCNDNVIGATINKQGAIIFKATKIGSETLLSHIIQMVQEAQGSRAPIQALADRISGVFVPVVLGIALLSFVLWLVVGIPLLGQQLAVSYAILSFVGVLVIACPCALGLATPTAIIVGVGKGAEHGILIKDAEALQRLSAVTTVVFDKTGTLTNGTPEVTEVLPLGEGTSVSDLVSLAASVEKKSEHPLAAAIVSYALEKKYTVSPVTDFKASEGIGVSAYVNKVKVVIRKPATADKQDVLLILQKQGKTVVVVERDGTAIGLIALSDTIKSNAKEAVAKLQKSGIEVILLTGDNQRAASYIAEQAGITKVYAEVLPHEKALKVAELQGKNKVVAMAGDGINDAPALAQADVGIAMANGTDIAVESAGITLLHGDINKVAQAISLSKKTMWTIKENLFWAFIFNMIGIPLAAGALYPVFGWHLNPAFAGLAMAFSSVLVVTNSLRLKTKKI